MDASHKVVGKRALIHTKNREKNPDSLDAVRPKYAHLLHGKEEDAAQPPAEPLRLVAIIFLVERFYAPPLHDLPLGTAAEEPRLVDAPGSN